MLDNYKLVYSDNPNHQPTKSAKKSSPNKPVMRLEKKGRGGKSVTVVTGLARSDEELKRICKELKATCGTGGNRQSASY
jgi:translation initiation factor 1